MGNQSAMRDETMDIRDAILQKLLENAIFDGVNWRAAERAAALVGYDPAMAAAVFPAGMDSLVTHFSDWADRRMLEALLPLDPSEMRVRDRIREAVKARLDVLAPYKEAVGDILTYRSLPLRQVGGAKAVWQTADRIWRWAGDTSTDYNYYTKRSLLAGVIGSTMMACISAPRKGGAQDSASMQDAYDFLDRRIENVMQFGKILGRITR